MRLCSLGPASCVKKLLKVSFVILVDMSVAQELYKYFGLYAFVIAWAGMLTVIINQGRDKARSISLHAASSRKTFLLLAVLSPLSMTLFMMFVVKWMAPKFDLPASFVILNVLAFTGYLLAAWFPAVQGIKGKIHDLFAYGASALLIPIALILATSQTIAIAPRIINGFSFLIMLGILVYLLSNKPARTHYLYFQIIYFLSFDIGLLTAGYLS